MNFYKSKFGILLSVFMVLMISSNAYAYKKEMKKAKKFIKAGSYEQAIEQLDIAIKHPKISEKKLLQAEEMMVESKREASKSLFARGKRFASKNKISKAIGAFATAVEYAPTNEEYSRHLEEQKAKLVKIETKIDAAYKRGSVDHKWDEALNELEGLRIYESSFPEINDRINSFKKEAGKFFLTKSDKHLLDKKYKKAYKAIEKTLKYSDDKEVQKMKNALHHLVMSEEAWGEQRYLKAYEEIMKGLEFRPDHEQLLAFENRLLEEWCGILYNEAVEAQNDGRFAAAKAKLTQLSKYKPGFLNTEEMLLEVTSTLASDSYDKAEGIIAGESRDYVATAVAHYLLVQEEHSNLYPDIDDKLATAKRLLKKELEFRVAIDFKNSSTEPGADGLVKEQILRRMKNSKALKNITILDRDSIDDILREQGLGQGFLDESTAVEVKKIKGIQAGIKGDVIKVTVKETGRDRPRYGSSRYISGKRYVPNPNYQSAQSRVQAAQQRVLQAQSDLNQQKQQSNQAMMNQSQGGKYTNLISGLGQIGSVLGEGAVNNAKRDLSDAQMDLANTPMQIEEEIESDYRYEIFDLTLLGEIVISLKVINYTTSEISDVHTVREESKVNDTYIPGDPGKNVSSDPIELPPMEEFKSALINKSIDKVFASLVQELGSAADSYYKLAKKADKMGIEEDAIENYMRYIYSAPNLKDEKVQEANEYLYDRLGLYVLRRKK